ncbi:MAG: glycosyltransferase family 2 protein [Clostridium sp.]|nr:glycosyltransferase family 2 protein [Clostridium sp.]
MNNSDDKEIKLSIGILVYNHKKYIDECLENILNQQMNFSYEIIVGNDCSTDGTEKALKKYENKMQIINREKNLGLCANMYDLCLRARGKYIFVMSGDDYLCDMQAMQKMSDFLDNHKEYYSVSAWHYLYNMQTKKLRSFVDERTPQECTLYNFLRNVDCFAIHGMIRNTFKTDREQNAYLVQGAKNNEEMKWYFYFLSKGKKYILQEYMYVYRFNAEGGSNYFATHSTLERFQDYYSDIKMMQKLFGSQYNFTPLLLQRCNGYCVKLSDNIGDLMKFLKMMSWKDKINLFWYKCYLKLHHYKNPPKWSEQSYYDRH